MKKILVTALMFSGALAGSAFAASGDDVQARLQALEKENAAIRAENNALRHNKTLRAQNAALKSSTAITSVPENDSRAKSSDPFGAYAADLPMAYKARPVEAPRQFRVWAEGGAIWSGGDPVNSDYTLTNFNGLVGLGGIGGVGGTIPGSFDLTPKVGWEGATGFDYRFAGSAWHVSGQFRYGEGKASGSASSAGAVDPVLLAALGADPGTAISGTDSINRSNKETHWLADLAVGRDVFGSGPDAMQVKLGVRIGEWIGKTTSTQSTAFNVTIPGGIDVLGDGSVLVSQISATTTNNLTQRASFIGAGPRIGVEGAVPLAGSWAFDYLGDVAVLFGNQKVVSSSSSSIAISPAILGALVGGGTNFTSTSELFSTALSADLQVGVSYWVTPNVKVSGSYRIDALMMFNTTAGATNSLPDRYTHGPRLGVSATF